jgi:hypothetical protein
MTPMRSSAAVVPRFESQTLVLNGVTEVSELEETSSEQPQEEKADASEASTSAKQDEPVVQGLHTTPAPEYNDIAEQSLLFTNRPVGTATVSSSKSSHFVSGLAIGCCATAVVAFAAIFYDKKKKRRRPQQRRYDDVSARGSYSAIELT